MSRNRAISTLLQTLARWLTFALILPISALGQTPGESKTNGLRNGNASCQVPAASGCSACSVNCVGGEAALCTPGLKRTGASPQCAEPATCVCKTAPGYVSQTVQPYFQANIGGAMFKTWKGSAVLEDAGRRVFMRIQDLSSDRDVFQCMVGKPGVGAYTFTESKLGSTPQPGEARCEYRPGGSSYRFSSGTLQILYPNTRREPLVIGGGFNAVATDARGKTIQITNGKFEFLVTTVR